MLPALQALADFLTRLAGAVVDDDANVHSYVLEIYLTLCALAQCLDGNDLAEFPQVLRGIKASSANSVPLPSVASRNIHFVHRAAAGVVQYCHAGMQPGA